ncbi:clan AA aspartic protease [Lusitaniella coriacea LEGE 07157]|uniref:Clan AA aspartic protease n=1 Tax=Lusitaniella coriacea LEGE 07157 TaxID=945747 RepID=A0A8J7DXL8_9CYAN|nr:retropepsin-like aspartic protease [Lusitaniella coriacea]MBE9117057.1 clan AA aspartic protease [Lusitaniella coriacea LEGE 07157]
MLLPSRRTTTSIALTSLFALGIVACGRDQTENKVESPAVAASNSADPYKQAINTASSAIKVTQGTPQQADWAKASQHWQQAIQHLQAVPASHPQHQAAQTKIPQYQRFLAVAQNKSKAANPPAAKTAKLPSGRDPYNEAIALASSAITVSQTAMVQEDWTIIAERWRQAVDYLKAVPSSHPQYQAAQAKIPQYQRFFTEAKDKANPPQSVQANTNEDVNPKFFSLPIKERTRGIPIVEVKFNGQQKFEMLFDTGASLTLLGGHMATALNLQPVDSALVTIADGSQVLVPLVKLDSIEASGRIKRNLTAAVAPSMPIGLLGQDFFEKYDYTIKQNAIEFRLRS